jgi:hypothetical protein
MPSFLAFFLVIDITSGVSDLATWRLKGLGVYFFGDVPLRILIAGA